MYDTKKIVAGVRVIILVLFINILSSCKNHSEGNSFFSTKDNTEKTKEAIYKKMFQKVQELERFVKKKSSI